MDAHSEQDELEKLKTWWKTYGNSLIAGVILGVGILFGGKYWTNYQNTQRESASAVYEEMLRSFRDKKREAVIAGAKRLQQDYSRTPYAGMAALLAARMQFDNADADGARQQLEWAVKNAKHDPVTHVARLRLARLHASAGRTDMALGLIPAKGFGGFEAEYHELRGDLLVAKGKRNEARQAYQEALRAQKDLGPYRQVLLIKLADLGESS